MTKKLRLKVVGCAVFQDELEALAGRSPNDLDVELLDAGLHAAPERLRLCAQEAIDRAGRDGGYDAVCLAYGLCGRGTAGLVARGLPVVIPRAHDCISLFLGSARAYAEQFAREPGTFYFTTGWYKHKAHPESLRMRAVRRFAPEAHPRFADLCEKHGTENARYVVEFLESWRRNYRRAALIDHGFVTGEQERATRAVAEAAGWHYERLEGSLALLDALLSGAWDEERFLVVEPGHVTVGTNDARILTAVPLPEGRDAATMAADPAEELGARAGTGVFVYGEPAGPGWADVGLGIDAGGTYTDAVLCEFATGRLLGTAKSPTTHRDLTAGIRSAVAGLDRALFGRVSYTCLSTTLATNAIVEGRGRHVGLILMPYHPAHARGIRTPLFRCVGGRTNIHGVPEQPVDEVEVLRAADELVGEGATAFAVSGYGAVRNPLHEQQVKGWLRRHCGLPVVCGHELTGRLDFVARAHTAVLNARLLPLITDLLDSVEEALGAVGIRAPLFVVRGDGAIMRKEAARERAVETILSGPAASAAGGLFLTGVEDALVVDVGGTTTDVAALEGGRLALSPEGARVGDWQTSVTAADIRTTGLGGDSAVRAAGRGRVTLGPDRAVPLCVLAARWPDLEAEMARLRSMRGEEPAAPDFFVLSGEPDGLTLEAQERRIVASLRDRPRSRAALSRECGALAPELLPVGRLERLGLVRRSGVTPTDALHVLGAYTEFDREAARMGLEALGSLVGLPAEQAARLVRHEAERLLAAALIRRELADAGYADGEADAAEALLGRASAGAGRGAFELLWRQHRPVVGIGAPVGAFLPGACERLGTRAVVPAHADVANAVGAVVSPVVVRELLRVRPGEGGSYVLFGPDGRQEFARLEEAERTARARVVELVRRGARHFGTDERQVRVEVARRVGHLRDGSVQLIEVQVAGTLSGGPAPASPP